MDGPGNGAPGSIGALRAGVAAVVAELLPDDPAGPPITEAVLAQVDEAALERYAAHIVDETRLRVAGGGPAMELEPARKLAAAWTAGARALLEGAQAPDYVEMNVSGDTDSDRYVFRLQRRAGLTPDQARHLAEERADRLAAVLAELAARAAAGALLSAADIFAVIGGQVAAGRSVLAG